jgi:hypothetical protein
MRAINWKSTVLAFPLLVSPQGSVLSSWGAAIASGESPRARVVKREGGDDVAFVKILCPVDFSGHSQRAVRFAALLARSFGSLTTVLHVNDPVLVATSAIVYAERPRKTHELS